MELLDVYDNNAKKLAELQSGEIKAFHLLKVSILLLLLSIQRIATMNFDTKTSVQKGGNYSSTGGHVDHGEEPIDAIIREVKEEIGIDISNDNIIDLDIYYLTFH